MTPDEIPHEYKELIDDVAGIDHSTNGAVMTVLAKILTLDRGSDEPSFLLHASDPAAPYALLSYASVCRNKGATDDYIERVKAVAERFFTWQDTHGIIPLGRSVMINSNIDRLFKSNEANDAAQSDDR